MEEQQFSEYSFDRSDAPAIRSEFELHEKQAKELLDGFKGWKGRTAFGSRCLLPTTIASSVRTSST